jgi:hypothetical protein
MHKLFSSLFGLSTSLIMETRLRSFFFNRSYKRRNVSNTELLSASNVLVEILSFKKQEEHKERT